MDIVTFSLGSCIGVTAYDPEAKIGGMIHYMLPLSKTSPEKAKAKPAMFADTGIPELLKQMFAMGAVKNRLIVKVVGGSQLMDKNKIFNIGERNYLVLRKLLWKNNILIAAEDVGGSMARTVRLNLDTGKVTVKSVKGLNEL
ncbi:MAG: chemotaxis protein CheD [FCB group bacterium]|nr:chemotaxis protein CheD [FCB group bacterium]